MALPKPDKKPSSSEKESASSSSPRGLKNLPKPEGRKSSSEKKKPTGLSAAALPRKKDSQTKLPLTEKKRSSLPKSDHQIKKITKTFNPEEEKVKEPIVDIEPETNNDEDDDFNLDNILDSIDDDLDNYDTEENLDDNNDNSTGDNQDDNSESTEEEEEDDFDLDEILASLEELEDTEQDSENELDIDTEPKENSRDEIEIEIDVDDTDFTLDDEDDNEGNADETEEKPEEDKKSSKKARDKTQNIKNSLSKITGPYLKLGAGFVSFLAKIPLIGKIFTLCKNNPKIHTIVSALIIPLLVITVWLVINILYVSSSEENNELPDEGSIKASVESYDKNTNTAIVTFENTGGIMLQSKAKIDIYSNQIGLNPLYWVIPQQITSCETDWEAISQSDITTVEASCKDTDDQGFWFRGSVKEILG